MSSIADEFLELTTQFQLFLIQEYSPQTWFQVSRESYLNYRSYAIALNQTAKKMNIQEAEVRREMPEVKAQGAKKQEVENKNQKIVENAIANSPKNAAIAPQKEKIVSASKKELEKPSTTREKQDNFADIRKMIAEHYPEQLILPQPPEDSLAKKIKNAWKTPSKTESFVANLCHALKVVYGIKAEVVGKSLQLGDAKNSVIELINIEEYLREPKLKANLWKTISIHPFSTSTNTKN